MIERGVRKNFVGLVVGNKMDKTAVVIVTRIKKHKTYNKYNKSQTKYMVHDPQNRCQVGDRVRIIETRPLSKRKRWQVLEIFKKSELADSPGEGTDSLEQKG